MRLILTIAAAATFVTVAHNEPPRYPVANVIPGPIPARVLGVLDGDTLRVRARIWLGQEVETRVRLAGIDAPELKGGCQFERDLARRARDLVASLVEHRAVMLLNVRHDKYGRRVTAHVTVDGTDLGEALLRSGLARSYDGRQRTIWCGSRQDDWPTEGGQ